MFLKLGIRASTNPQQASFLLPAVLQNVHAFPPHSLSAHQQCSSSPTYVSSASPTSKHPLRRTAAYSETWEESDNVLPFPPSVVTPSSLSSRTRDLLYSLPIVPLCASSAVHVLQLHHVRRCFEDNDGHRFFAQGEPLREKCRPVGHSARRQHGLAACLTEEQIGLLDLGATFLF